MFPAMDIKRERDSLARCGGCLSLDRPLRPLAAGATLYRALLGGQHTHQDSIDMCWECRAVLRRVMQFQLQIQRAQHILVQAEKGLYQEHITSLSRLTTRRVLLLSETADISSKAENFDNISQQFQEIQSITSPEYIPQDDSNQAYAETHKMEHNSHNDGDNYFQMTSKNDFAILFEEANDEDFRTENQQKIVQNIVKDPKIKKRSFKKRHKLFDTVYIEVLEPVEDMRPYCTEIRVEMSRCEAWEMEVWGKPYQCRMCHYGFDSQMELNDHVEFICFRRKYKIDMSLCVICQEREDERRVPLTPATADTLRQFQTSFATRDQLQDVLHMRMFDLLRDVVRELPAREVRWHDACLVWFTSEEHIARAESRYRASQATVVGDAQQSSEGDHVTYYKCVLCNYTSRGRHEQERHLKSTHTTLYQCPQCRRLAEDKHRARHHFMRFHKMLECDVCGLKCARSAMKKHLRDHPPSVCTLCNIAYETHEQLRAHNNLAHPVAEPAPEENFCVECNKQYKTKVAFKMHLKSRIHAPDRDTWRYACADCEQVFHNEYFLRVHRTRTHRHVNSHGCSVCDKKFTCKTYLMRHFKGVHEKRERARDKLCGVCGKGFYTKPTLVNHMRTHTGERPFPCDYCPARFTQRAAAVTHMRLVHKLTNNQQHS